MDPALHVDIHSQDASTDGSHLLTLGHNGVDQRLLARLGIQKLINNVDTVLAVADGSSEHAKTLHEFLLLKLDHLFQLGVGAHGLLTGLLCFGVQRTDPGLTQKVKSNRPF